MGQAETNKKFGRLTFASLTKPINAALAGAGTLFLVAGAAHPGGLAVVGAGMLAGTLGMMWRDVNNQKFVDEVLNDGGPLKALPEVPDTLSGQYRLSCLEAKRHMEKTLEAIDASELGSELTPVRDQIVEQVASVYRLADRAHRLDGSLTVSSRNEINKEIQKIQGQMVLTADPMTRKHLERTLEQKQEQLKTYDELALQVKRIQAQIQSINAVLENVQFKVMKIGTADPGGTHTEDLTRSLHDLLEEVQQFENSLDAVAEDPALLGPGTLEAWDERAQARNRLPTGLPSNQDALPGEIPGPPGPGA